MVCGMAFYKQTRLKTDNAQVVFEQQLCSGNTALTRLVMLNASIQSGALGGILSSYRWLATFHRRVVLGAARYFRPEKG